MAQRRQNRTPRAPVPDPDEVDQDHPPVYPDGSAHDFRADAQEVLRAGYKDEAARLYWLCGYTFGMIAVLCHYEDWLAAKIAVQTVLTREKRFKRELRQDAEAQRLLRLETKLQPFIEDGNLEAIRLAKELGESRRELYGDDDPDPLPNPPLPSLAEQERQVLAIAVATGQDPEVLRQRLHGLLGQHGLLTDGAGGEKKPAVIEGEAREMGPDDG